MSSKFVRNYLPELFALGIVRHGPAMVTINITDRCNQQCLYCEIGKGIPSVKSGRLTTEDLFWVIDEMDHCNIRKLSLCGGEPFLFRDLIEVIAYAGTRRIRCSVTTNGTTVFKLNEKELEVLKNCKGEVNVSLDSLDEEVQSVTRGTSSSLPGVLKSIRVLQDKDIPVTVLCAVSKYNFRGLYGFLVALHQLGIRQVLFQPVISSSNYPDRHAIDHKSELNVPAGQLDVLMDQLKKMMQFERSHRIKTNVYRILPWISHYLQKAAGQNGNWFFEAVIPAFYCREIYSIIDIAYDGGIQPCGLRPASVSICEDREKGLMALWKKATEGIRDDLENNRYYPECNGCCHHFSRNMLASMVKHPLKNHQAWAVMTPLLFRRAVTAFAKKLNVL